MDKIEVNVLDTHSMGKYHYEIIINDTKIVLTDKRALKQLIKHLKEAWQKI